MVVETIFSDYVVNPSDLRTNQKHWLEEATKRPVTVNYSHIQLAILNRDQVRLLYLKVRFADLVISLCHDIKKGSALDMLPWLEKLSNKEKLEFREEMLNCFLKSNKTEHWEDMENLIADWQATAEAKRSPDLIKALKDAESPSDYTRLSD